MAVIYNTTVKTARMVIVRDAIDAGAGPGHLQLGTVGFGLLLVALDLNEPCGAVAGDVLALTPPPLDAVGVAPGQAAAARVVDGNGVVVVDGLTVGTTNANVLLTTTTIAVDQPVDLVSATITHG